MNAGELLVKLGFEVDTLKLNEFIKDLGDLNLSSVLAAAGIKGMVDGLTDIMKTADRVGDSFNKLTGITGIQQQVFQGWENAAKQFNITAGLTSSTIEQIQQHIGQLKFGDPFAIKLQQLFGVQAAGREGDAQGVYRDILKSMESMTREDARDRLIKAGLNVELLNYRGHLKEIEKQLTNTSSDFNKIWDYNTKINRLSADWAVFITAVGAALAPILGPLLDILDGLLDFIVEIEQATPEWLKDLLAVAAVWGTIYGIIRAVIVSLGVLSGLSALKFLAPLIGAAIPALTAAAPWIAGGAAAVGGGIELFHLLNRKDNGSSNVDNSGDVSMQNTYNITGNNPDDLARRIQEYHEAQLRNVQGQSRLSYI